MKKSEKNGTPRKWPKETDELLLGLPFVSNQINHMRKTMSMTDRKWQYTGMSNGQEKQHSKIETACHDNIISYSGEAHLMTVAPPGTGKNRSVIMPVLLSYPGPVIVLDVKGENYAVTARYRREIGHQVIALDPFSMMTDNSGGFNPFDIFKLNIKDADAEAMFMAELFARGNAFLRDPFWDNNAMGLISGVLAYMISDAENNNCTLNRMRQVFMGDDPVYKLAVVLDTMKAKISEMAYEEIAAFLSLPDTNTRPSVLGTVNSYLKPFGAECVRKSLEQSTFSLQDIIDGKPLSIYIIIPPDKLESYSGLLRLWIGVLFKAITMRKVIPPLRTLFILDECAQLGSFSFLGTAITLLRGYGLQTWSFWQDLNQLNSNYGNQSHTIINNCAVFQSFGVNNAIAAKAISGLLNIDHEDVSSLNSDEQLILLNGKRILKARKMDYLTDKMFEGRWDPNPYYNLIKLALGFRA